MAQEENMNLDPIIGSILFPFVALWVIEMLLKPLPLVGGYLSAGVRWIRHLPFRVSWWIAKKIGRAFIAGAKKGLKALGKKIFPSQQPPPRSP